MRTRIIYGICAAVVLGLALGGCAALIGGAASGELSANLALASTGSTANDPLFNDGNVYTQAPTRTPMVARDDPDWRDAELYTVAEVRFKQPTKVNQIAVKSKDLDKPLKQGMWIALEYLKDDEWKTARKWKHGAAPRNPKASIDATADGVRVRIKRPTAFFSGGGLAAGQSSDSGERLIYEVEAYQYVSKEQLPADEG